MLLLLQKLSSQGFKLGRKINGTAGLVPQNVDWPRIVCTFHQIKEKILSPDNMHLNYIDLNALRHL